MELFVKVMFWAYLVSFVLKVMTMVTGAYKQSNSIGVRAAEAVVQAALCIWAGFVLWY